MARPKTSDNKKQIIPDITVKELWMKLDAAMKHSGMYSHIAVTPELKFLLEESEDKQAGRTSDRDTLLYNSRVKVARHVIAGSPAWLARVVSNPKRIAPIVDIKEMFLKHGPDALPSHYKHAEKFGGLFRWDGPDASITVVMMVRGIGKTHIEVVIESLHGFIVAPHHKMLMGHGEEDKAKDNLKRVRDALFHPYLMVIYPEFFVDNPEMYRNRGVEIGKSRINMRTTDFEDMWRMIDPTDYMRGEATWNLFTPKIDVTGQHYNRAIIDDFVTDDNSINWERQKRIIDVFDGLTGLEEYEFDNKGNRVETGFPIKVVGTQKIIPNLYTDIFQNRKIKTFIVPMTWDPDEHKTIYSYCKEHKYKIWDKLVTGKFIDQKKDDFKTEEKFLAECYMKGRPRSEVIKLISDRSEIIFGYADETNISESKKVRWEKEQLHSDFVVLFSKDLAYSSGSKKEGDAKSRDVALRVVYTGKQFLITGSYSALGNDTVSKQKAPLVKFYEDTGYPEYILLDAQGTQMLVANEIESSLQEDEFMGKPEIIYIHYTKPKESDTIGKSSRIQSVLGTLCREGVIKIHWKLIDVIKQFLREDPGFDFLDAMVQVMSIPVDEINSLSYLKKMYNNVDKNPPKITGGNSVLFETTGY